MKRIAALALCAVLTAGLFSGCSTQDDPYVPTGDGLYDDSATEPTEAEVTLTQLSMPYYPDRQLNPYQCTDYNNRPVLSLIYQGLFAVDREYQSWPILCDSYQVSWDMKTYTFHLAKATFSDGTAVTAQDVEASLKAAKKGSAYKGRFGYVDSIRATEEGTLEIELETPMENLPVLLDVPIVKAAEVEAEAPLGTGPYVLSRGEEAALQRRSDWWCNGGVPVTASRIRLVEGGTAAELRDAFEFSNLSMVPADPGSDQYADFHSDYELWESENGIFLYLGFNTKSKVLSEKEIRQGILYAVDRDAIISDCYRGFATAAVLPASPNSPCYSQSLAAQYRYDPMVLTQAVDQNLELVSGKTLILLVNSDDAVRVRAANSIARELNKCGLHVTVTGQPTKEYKKSLEDGKFDLYLGQTRLSANMDLTAFFSADGNLNCGGLDDPVLYALCMDALANIGNYYNLHQRVLEKGLLCPILFRSYAVYTQRGSFRGLIPSRDNPFFYHLGKTVQEALIQE